MEKKNTIPKQPVKTKTTVNTTAASNALKGNHNEPVKPLKQKNSKVPFVKDIDEGSPERK
ncbi:MAG: hypothetical protein V4539_03510 [Bacteroidota bacterium]